MRRHMFRFVSLYTLCAGSALAQPSPAADGSCVVACDESAVTCRRACITFDVDGNVELHNEAALESCLEACSDAAFDCANTCPAPAAPFP